MSKPRQPTSMLPNYIKSKQGMSQSKVRAKSIDIGEYFEGKLCFGPYTTSVLHRQYHWLEGHSLVLVPVNPYTVMRISPYVDVDGKNIVEEDTMTLRTGDKSVEGQVYYSAHTGLGTWYVKISKDITVKLRDIVTHKDKIQVFVGRA